MIRTERESIKGEETMMGTSMNTHLMGMIKAMLALAVTGALGLFSPAPAGAVDLLHNSRDTASPKWQANGGWGIAGGKYGEFTCSTCHEPNTNPNIKNVRRTIRTRSGENWPNGQPTVTVEFRNSTSMGDDTGGHADSSRICEVCHSQNRFHNANTANNTGGLSHPSPKGVCTSCHKHNTGFKAACGGCHGNPPTQAVLGGDTGMIGTPRPSNALEPGQVGAHVTHTETRSMVCDTCHYISNGTVRMPNLSNTIDIGFFGFGGKVTSGTYTPYTSVDRGFRIASGTPNSTIAAAVTDYPSANRCSGVYCHGGGVKVGQTQVRPPLTGGTNTSPRWDGAGQDQCGSCHGTTAATPPTTGGHVKHAGSTGNSFSCDLCHPAIDVTHVQGSVRWAFKTSDARIGGAAAYQAAGAPGATTAGATGDLAPSASFGQCSNIYCHSDGNGGVAYVATPTWGDSLPPGCVGCHGNSAASVNPIASKGHKAHVNNTSTRFGNFNFRCNECHSSVVDATGTTLVNMSLHANASRDVAWGPKSTGGANYATNGCSQIYCHSNGQGTYKAPPTTWGAIVEGQQGTIQCDYCHGGLASNGTPVSSMRHSNHIGSGPLPHRPIQCSWCHSNTVGSDGQSVFNGTDVKHINRSIDVTFIKMANFSGSYDPATRVCANTYCHTNNATTSTRDWDTTTVNTCGNCHEANNTTTASAKLSDAHRKHYNSSTRPANSTDEGWTNVNRSSTNNVFMCGTCHPANPTASHINGPPAGVTNGSVAEIVLRLPFTPPAGAERAETVSRGSGVNYDGRGYGYSTGTSCNTYCHSDGRGGPPKNTMSWAVTTTSCGNCHNQYGDNPATTTWSGSHNKHLAGTTSANATCNACHAATAANNTTLIVSRRDRHPNGFRNVTGNSIAGGFTWDSGAQQCTNVYCHFSKPVTWGGTLAAGCVGCHGNNATSGDPIVSKGHKAHVNNTSTRFSGFNFRCNECHNSTVDSTDKTLISTTLHANRTADVSWGPKSTGGLAYATNGCSQIYCHSNGQGTYKAPPTTWGTIAEGQQGTIQCDYCHGGLASNGTPVSSLRHTNHIGSGPLPHRPIQCNWCHSNTVGSDGQSVFNGTDVKHINRSIDVTFIKMANFSGSYDPATRVCANTYCHTNNPTTSTRDWDTTTANTCGNCHEANNSTTATAKLSDAHRKHYNRSTRPSNTTDEGWTNVNLSTTNNVFMCGTCHPATPTESHLNGPPSGVTNGSVAEIVLRLPFTTPQGSGRYETVTRGSGVNYDGRGYGYSTGTSCDTYCHSDGRGGPPKNVMQWAVSTTSCGNCHDQASNNPATTTWSAPHNKHANTYGNGGTIGSNNTTTNNTLVTCAACHASTASSNTALATNQRAKHPNGFRNVSASSTVGSAAFRWDSGNNQCKNGYCHSRAYSFTDYSTPWIKWDQSKADIHCGSCHNSYPTGPNYANGYKGKANSHPKHAVFWGFTCDWCHNQTVAFRNVTTMYISTVRNHVNKNYNVVANGTKTFIGKANTFTATATTSPPTVKTTCSSVNCHGGNTSKVFTWGGTNKCGDCHFATNDTVNYGFKNGTMAVISRTEWRYSGHGKVSGAYDVTGATFAGFSAAAANGTSNPGGDPCLYCHEYDSVMHGSADNPLRLRNFNTGVQTWGKNGVCLVCHATSGATGVQPAAGYTLKTATRKVDKYHYGSKHSTSLTGGQFCWDCHDAHGDRASGTDQRPIAMVHKKPAKGSDSVTGMPTFLTVTTVGNFVAKTNAANFSKTTAPYNALCNVCHDNKIDDPSKMVHYTATSSDSHQSTKVCTTCHSHSADATYDGNAYQGLASACDGCHGGNNSGQLSVNTTAGHAIHYNQATVFNHYTGSNKHTAAAYGFACKNCHGTTLTNHQNGGTANVLGTIGYTQGGTLTADGAGYNYYNADTCGQNACHQDGKGGAPKTATFSWGSAKSSPNCNKCHNGAGDASPTWSGAHTKHINGYNGNSRLTCAACHSNTAGSNTTIADARNHANGTKTVVINATITGVYTAGTGCINTKCHSNGTDIATGAAASHAAVSWTAAPGSLGCTGCHASPPNYANNSPKKNSHAAGGHQIGCDKCHYSVTTNGTTITGVIAHNNGFYNVSSSTSQFHYVYNAGGGTCSNVACHGTAQWGVTVMDCVGCHGSSVAIKAGPLANTGSRRAIQPEFAATWSHKASGGRTVVAADCIVCHMEGDKSTGKTSAKHADGFINLRDADTGLEIANVSWDNGTPGSFVPAAGNASFSRFSRDLGATLEADPNFLTIAAVEVNHCLKCHDSDGALDANAQVPTTGTAGRPFGVAVASTGTNANSVAAGNTTSNVVNVASSFATTNASYHPVLGKGNNGFTGGTKMKAPWNGTLSPAKPGSGSTTVYGFLISCWDCHADTTDAWGNTTVQTSTVTAHGNGTTIRATVFANYPNLCTKCHADTYGSGTGGHGTGSAAATTSSQIGSSHANCNNCHSSFNNSRPWRGVDAHGFNEMSQVRTDSTTPANSLTWTASGAKPWAFIRTANLGNWRPAKGTGLTDATSGTCGRATTGCSNSHGSYSPGGWY